eukprot:1161672-Pelagomonas_calceolata.AAC.6
MTARQAAQKSKLYLHLWVEAAGVAAGLPTTQKTTSPSREAACSQKCLGLALAAKDHLGTATLMAASALV